VDERIWVLIIHHDESDGSESTAPVEIEGNCHDAGVGRGGLYSFLKSHAISTLYKNKTTVDVSAINAPHYLYYITTFPIID